MIRRRQRGAALFVTLIAMALAASYALLRWANVSGDRTSRDKVTAAALAQAKEALIGFAASYRDGHPSPLGQIDGYLPCPDTNNDGIAEPSCGTTDVSTIGRLPWKTLGIPPLRDGSGECLWYAVSGHGKYNPTTGTLNWDTTGQLIVRDAGGATLTGPTPHDYAMAVVFAPLAALGTQDRSAAITSDCGGNSTPAAYLEGATLNPAANAASTITLSTTASVDAGTNNDRGIWITQKEIFERAKRRSVFKAETDTLMADVAACLNALPPGGLPASSGSKGIAGVVTTCPATPPQKAKVLANWQDNLLYAKPASAIVYNGNTCNALLLFGGERTASQDRSTAALKNSATSYLEGINATLFPNAGTYTGANGFAYASASADLAQCIKGLPAGAAQYSFTRDFGSFVPTGAGVTVDTVNQVVTIVTGGPGNRGGCFWFPAPIPVAGKTLRSYQEFRFSNADTRALTGSGTDHGYGFTFQLVHSGHGSPTAVCGYATDMGAMALGGPGTVWGNHSLIVENDVYRDSGNSDPVANHVAIMANGNLAHSPTNGNATTACNGTAQGCAQSPANGFEETPAPVDHRQRLEIATGCDPTCATCVPAAHTPPNTYARIRLWVDCADCMDVTADFSATTPNAQRCIDLSFPDLGLNSAYFGFSGGFRSGAGAQGVTISNFIIRSE